MTSYTRPRLKGLSSEAEMAGMTMESRIQDIDETSMLVTFDQVSTTTSWNSLYRIRRSEGEISTGDTVYEQPWSLAC